MVGLVAVLLALFPALSVNQVNNPLPKLQIDMAKLYPDDTANQTLLVLSVTNTGAAVATAVNVQIANNCCSIPSGFSIDDVPPGVDRVSTHVLQGTVRGGTLLIQYSVGNQRLGTALILGEPAPSPSLLASPAAPGALGLLGVVVGGILAHLFTQRRERRQTDFQWRKMLFEKYEGPFAAFLSSWKQSTNADSLDVEFSKLQESVVVPAPVVGQYHATRAVLGSNTDVQEKVSAALELQRTMQENLADLIKNKRRFPWSRRSD